MLVGGLLCGVLGFSPEAMGLDFGFFPLIHFVPNSQTFWDNSKNWTTNFGPAYRDTVEKPENMVPCTGRYALCFHSGAEPFPCRLTPDGRFANCKCTIEEGLNFVLISAILNYQVYLDTIAVCGTDGSQCADVPDKAPVSGHQGQKAHPRRAAHFHVQRRRPGGHQDDPGRLHRFRRDRLSQGTLRRLHDRAVQEDLVGRCRVLVSGLLGSLPADGGRRAVHPPSSSGPVRGVCASARHRVMQDR
jgi:hypothetical protein